ncbi:MAG: translation initiation factor IF-3, partial [bacterium]
MGPPHTQGDGHRQEDPIAPRTRINDEIRAREVRVIGPDGEQLGILTVPEAMQIAIEKELDLVEIAPQSEPPVVKVMDYGKYKYESNKKAG